MRAYNAIKVGGLEIGFLSVEGKQPVFMVKMGDPFEPEEQELDAEDLQSILDFINRWKPLLQEPENG